MAEQSFAYIGTVMLRLSGSVSVTQPRNSPSSDLTKSGKFFNTFHWAKDSQVAIILTHLLWEGRYYCMVDLLNYWFEFNKTSKSGDNFNVTKLLNSNKSNSRSTTQ